MAAPSEIHKLEAQPERAAWKVSVAGFAANLASQVLYPLENVKFRFMAGNNASNNPVPAYQSIWQALKMMYANEGVGALYRGMTMNIFAGSVANSLFFYVYADGKRKYDYDPSRPYSWKTLVISYRAGIASMLVTTPFWTVKTRMVLF